MRGENRRRDSPHASGNRRNPAHRFFYGLIIHIAAEPAVFIHIDSNINNHCAIFYECFIN